MGFFDHENTGSIGWIITNDFAVGSDYSVKIVSVEDNSISGESGLFTISDDGDTDDSRIWVHISFLGNYINSLCFFGGAVPMTGHMKLIDASGNELSIAPYGCIDTGPIETLCPDGSGYWRSYSAWEIDQASQTQPTQEQLLETVCNDSVSGDCHPAWYPVDIPAGFQPVQYVAGCSIYLPFNFF